LAQKAWKSMEMDTAADCRRYARECLLNAEKAETEEDWSAFISLARDWMLAAARLEGNSVSDRGKITAAMHTRNEIRSQT